MIGMLFFVIYPTFQLSGNRVFGSPTESENSKLLRREGLFFDIDAFHTRRDGCEYLIGYGTYRVGKLNHRESFTEEYHRVTFVGRNICHIYHGEVHAYISYDGCEVPVDKYFSFPVAELSVQPVGVAKPDGSYACVTMQYFFSSIADGLVRGDLFNL